MNIPNTRIIRTESRCELTADDGHCIVAAGRNPCPLDVQPQGCEEHRFIPPMITFADPIDVTDSGSVLYRHHADGMYWANGPHGDEIKDLNGELIPLYPSHELAGQPAAVVGDPTVGLIKTTFAAEVV